MWSSSAVCRKLHIALLEAREDVCNGISRAILAIVCPDYDHEPGTRALCVRNTNGCVKNSHTFDDLS